MHAKRTARQLSTLRGSLLATALLAIGAAPSSGATDFSFAGGFVVDNQIQPFEFDVLTSRDVELRTWSFAGGTNAAGTVILRGGFDPIVSVFNAAGSLIEFNDDGGIVADPVTGQAWDSFLALRLEPGKYTATVTQFSNFPQGSNLSDGFAFDQIPHFASGFGGRSAHWALDIANVDSALALAPLTPAIPEPSVAILLLAGLGCTLTIARRRVSR